MALVRNVGMAYGGHKIESGLIFYMGLDCNDWVLFGHRQWRWGKDWTWAVQMWYMYYLDMDCTDGASYKQDRHILYRYILTIPYPPCRLVFV